MAHKYLDAMKQENNGYVKYKFYHNRQPIIPFNEVWYFKFIKLGLPKSIQINTSKGMRNVFLYSAYLKPNTKDYNGDPVWVDLTPTMYKFIKEKLNPKPDNILGFKTHIYETEDGKKKGINIFKITEKSLPQNSESFKGAGARQFNTVKDATPDIDDIDVEDII